MKCFHIVRKSFRDMKYVLADGIVIGDEPIREGDVFNQLERYARSKKIKTIWERRPNMLVETVPTRLEVESIEVVNCKPQIVEPGVGCKLVLYGNDNVRSNDIILVK